MITKYSDLRVWDYGGTMKVRDRSEEKLKMMTKSEYNKLTF